MATNLTGLLGQIGNTIGEMGEPGRQYVQTFRDMQAPNLDMDSPESMAAYGEYLRRNGRQEEAMAMMKDAQARKMALRTNEGQAKIMAAAKNIATMPEGPMKEAALVKISELAKQYEVPALQVQQILESQSLARGQLANEVKQTGIQQQRADQDLMRIENQAEQFGLTLEEDKRQFDTQMDFNQSQLDEERRINSHRIWRGKQEIRQGDVSLSLEEARVEIAKELANEEITMGEFRRVIMGNEDARAEDLHPIEMQLKEAQVSVALANAGYTEAQTKDVMYELGFKRDTEDLRADAMELNNQKTAEEIKTERANTDYIKNRTKQVTAEIELGRDRYNLEERRLGWDMGMDQSKLQLQERIANSQINLRQAQVDEIAASIESTVLRDELLVAKAESEKISGAFKAAYALNIDLNNPKAIANAKQMFITANGPEFAMDFDEAIEQRIKIQNLIDQTGSDALLRADSGPRSVAQLEAAGMSPQDIDAYKLLTDPQEKNQFVQTWAKRMNTPEVGGAPTNQLMEIYAGAAERMRKDIFGWDFPFGMDGDAIEQDVSLAMASAAAANKTANEVWLAGLEATFPYLQEQGSASSAMSAEGYRRRYGGDQ